MTNFIWRKNLYLKFCSWRKTPKKKSNFQNFRKFRVILENCTYAMLISVFYSIRTRNLKKLELFWENLKIPEGLYIKYHQILKNLFKISNLRLESERPGNIDFPRNRTYILGASSVHRRTFSFQLDFRYQGPRKQGFWLHHVLGDFFPLM